MDLLKGIQSNSNSVGKSKIIESMDMEKDSEVINTLSICDEKRIERSHQQQFVDKAFDIPTKLCNLKSDEKSIKPDSQKTESPMFPNRDISNRREKPLIDDEYEFLKINAVEILARILDRSPGKILQKFNDMCSLKTLKCKHRLSKDKHLKEFYKAEKCLNIPSFGEIMHPECIDFETMDFESCFEESPNDSAYHFYYYDEIEDGKDLPPADDTVSIRSYESIENQLHPNDSILNAQLLFEEDNMERDRFFIENVLDMEKELFTGAIYKMLESKNLVPMNPNFKDNKSENGQLHKSYGTEHNDCIRPNAILEKTPSSLTPQSIQSKIPCVNGDSPKSKKCVCKRGARRAKENIHTSGNQRDQVGRMGMDVSQEKVSEKMSLFSHLNTLDFKKVTDLKESIQQCLPKTNNLLRSSEEFRKSLIGIGATLGLGKQWQEELAKLEKQGFFSSSNAQHEFKKLKKFINASFIEILTPICDKPLSKMKPQPPVPTRKPKKVANNTSKKQVSHHEIDRKQSLSTTKMNTKVIKSGDDKKTLHKKQADEKKAGNAKNPKLASIPADKNAKIHRVQRYSAKFKSSNKLPNRKYSGVRKNNKFVEAKTQFEKPIQFKIVPPPLSVYLTAPSMNQKVLLKNKPHKKGQIDALKNLKTPLEISRKIQLKKSLSARNVIPKEKTKKF